MGLDNKASPRANLREALVEMTRLNNLSDGVFAIALTLLAFDLRLAEGVPSSDLSNQLLRLAPKLIVFLISFVVIGGAWGAHQRMLQQIKRGDGVLVWFNLACLLFVALIPASAALLGRYPSEFLAITCFALDVAFIELTTLWLWQHASRGGLINPRLDPRVVLSIGRRLKLSTAIFVLTIPLALWKPWIIYLFWIGLFILLFTTDWLAWQLASRTQQTSFPLDDVKRANIQVQHFAGLLEINSEAKGNILLNGLFGGGLASEMDPSGDAANIQLHVPERSGLLSYQYPWSWGSASVLDWTLHLSDAIPIALEIDSSSGIVALELGALQITELKIKTNSSEMDIALPDRQGQTVVQIDADTAKLRITIPPTVAAYIHTPPSESFIIPKLDLERFPMIVEGREYRSKRYKTASKRVDIQIEGKMSPVEIV